jgi:hypothetical protein
MEAHGEQSDTAPGVEPVMDERQFRRVTLHEHSGQRGA